MDCGGDDRIASGMATMLDVPRIRKGERSITKSNFEDEYMTPNRPAVSNFLGGLTIATRDPNHSDRQHFKTCIL